MTSNPQPTPSGPQPVQPEDLVSYLDGEADDVSADAIEHEIAVNPKVRGEIDSLQRAWDLLDHLERPHAKKDFTSRTMELATRSLPANSPLAPPPKLWPGPFLWGSSLIAVAAIAGTIVWFLPSLSPSVVQKQAILENLDVYRATQEIEFLQSLEDQHLLDQMDRVLEPEG